LFGFSEGAPPVGCRRVHSHRFSHEFPEDPPILPIDSDIEPVLCTAANEQVAGNVAGHLGIFAIVFSSNGKENLKGRAKLKVLERRFGTRQFDYAGDSWADLAVWRRARSAIVVNASPWTVLALRLLGVSISRSFSGRGPQL
jgi:hypothetical protein